LLISHLRLVNHKNQQQPVQAGVVTAFASAINMPMHLTGMHLTKAGWLTVLFAQKVVTQPEDQKTN
jgi:hypothetical protein